MPVAPTQISDLSRIRPRRDSLMTALLVFAITTFSNLTVYAIASRGLLDEVQQNLRDLGNVAALMTDGDLHQTLTKPTQKGSEEYLQVQAPYRMLLKASPALRYVYTCYMHDNKVYFTIDTQPENIGSDTEITRKSTANITEEYPDATAALRTALVEQKQVVEESSYTDEWGTFISGYTPIYTSSREFIGIVGVDIDATEFNHRMFKVRLALALGTVLAIAFSIVIGLAVYRARRSHETLAIARQIRLQQTSDFHKHIRGAVTIISDAAQLIDNKVTHISTMAKNSNERTQEAQATIRGASSRFQAISDASQRLLEVLTTLSRTIEGVQTHVNDLRHGDTESARGEAAINGIALLMQESLQTLEEQRDVVGYIDEDIADVTERTKTIVEMVKSITEMSLSTGNQISEIQNAVHSLHQQTAGLRSEVEIFMKKVGA